MAQKQIIFGTHAVRAAWDNPAREIHAFFATPEALRGFGDLKTGAPRPAPQILTAKDLDKKTRGAVHQGLVIEAAPLPETDIQDFIISAEQRSRTLLVMLDQVTDPHNVGAIMRSACAFGASGLILQKKHAPEAEGTLAKTASGAAEFVPIAYETNLSRAIESLQDAGFFVYGLDERGARHLGELGTPPEKAVIVLGAEGPGIRHLVKEHCDELLRLPTSGPISSLNVSNAAAISLYAFAHQNAK